MPDLQSSIARLESWRAEYGDGDGYPCVKWSEVRAVLDALAAGRDAQAHWYSVDCHGMATLCSSESAAHVAAAENAIAWPNRAPHRAMQLVDAAEVAKLRADLAGHADALRELVAVVPAGGGYLSKRAWDALEMARHVLAREALSASEAARDAEHADHSEALGASGRPLGDAIGGCVMEWQPIETAPKDGTSILATWHYTWKKGAPHIEACETGEEGLWFYTYDGDQPIVPPTHWMPLPAPPSVPSDGRESP